VLFGVFFGQNPQKNPKKEGSTKKNIKIKAPPHLVTPPQETRVWGEKPRPKRKRKHKKKKPTEKKLWQKEANKKNRWGGTQKKKQPKPPTLVSGLGGGEGFFWGGFIFF